MLSRNALAMGLAWHKSLQTAGQEASAPSHVCHEHAGAAVPAVAFPSCQGKAGLLLLWCCDAAGKAVNPAASSLLQPELVSLRGTGGSRPGKASGRAKL